MRLLKSWQMKKGSVVDVISVGFPIRSFRQANEKLKESVMTLNNILHRLDTLPNSKHITVSLYILPI